MRYSILIALIITLFSCKEEVLNPYDNSDLNPPVEDTTNYFNDPTNFSNLYNDVFQPYCANSGCHDGAFEPDYRSIESAYNTMVYQPIVKNDAGNTYEYRVKPMDSEKSILYARLILDIDSISGIMPLSAAYNNEHVWHNVKEKLISNVKSWIDDGAKDRFGNSPDFPNNKPVMKGVIAYESGQSTLLQREINKGSILIPATANTIDIWFSVTDDELNPNQLTYNKIKISDNLFDFATQTAYDLTIVNNPITELGFENNQSVNYYHKYTYDVSSLLSGDERFIKIYVKDDVNPITEIPTNGSDFSQIKYFTLEKE